MFHEKIEASQYFTEKILRIYFQLFVIYFIINGQDIEMTTVMNQKLAKAYIKTLQDKLMKKVKLVNKKIGTEELVQMIFELLPPRAGCQLKASQAMLIVQKNHEEIVDNRCHIQYLKRKAQLEDELTASFIKTIMKQKQKEKERSKLGFDSISKVILRKQRDSSSYLNPTSSMSRYDCSRISSRINLDQSIYEKSPIASIEKKDREQSLSYGLCVTQRSRVSPCRYQSTQLSQEFEPEQRQKIKALKKLRKLQKYVFEKQNIHRDKSLTKIWNYGLSPTKMRYKQENQNLKVIQSNLVTHLSLMQKFRQVPSIEGLVAREEILKKKERNLKQLSEALEKKQLQLNKRHSEFLKRQKSQKVL